MILDSIRGRPVPNAAVPIGWNRKSSRSMGAKDSSKSDRISGGCSSAAAPTSVQPTNSSLAWKSCWSRKMQRNVFSGRVGAQQRTPNNDPGYRSNRRNGYPNETIARRRMRALRLASSSLSSGWGTILLVGILGLNLQSVESAWVKSGHLTVHRNLDASASAAQQNRIGVQPSNF